MPAVPATQDGDREALLNDAATFLRDPKVVSSPLTQKVQFLESKGLTSAEIELALHRASATTDNPSTPQQSDEWGYDQNTHASGSSGTKRNAAPVTYSGDGYSSRQGLMRAPELPRRDWRDLFIMAVVSGGVMYGVASLARKYLMPHLQPPSSTAFQSTSEELASQFDEATTLLKSLQDQTSVLQSTIEEDRLKVDAVVTEVEEGIKRVSDGEDRWREELRELRDEVAELRELVPKASHDLTMKPDFKRASGGQYVRADSIHLHATQMIEKHSQTQQTALQDLQAELRSLKTLLVARRPGTGINLPTSSPPQASSEQHSSRPNGTSTVTQPPPPSSEITNAANALLQPRSSSATSGSYTGMFGGAGGKPSIPAWQLAAAQSYKDAQGPVQNGTGATSGRSTPAEENRAEGSGSGND